MKAKEARERALEITGEKEREQYNDIHENIQVAVDQGNLSCNFYEYPMPAVKKKLEEEGYVIKSESFRNETTTTISW